MTRAKRTMMFAIAMSAAILASALLPSAQSCGMLSGDIATLVTQQAPWYCPINQAVYDQWAGSMPIVLAAVLMSFMISSMLLMVGIALRNDKLRNFGVAEIYESIATTLVVALFLYINAVMFGILPAITVGAINPYATAFNLISQTISSATQMYSSLFVLYVDAKFATTIASFSLWAKALALAADMPLTVLFMDPAIALTGFLASGITALYAQYYLMVFFASAAIPAFLVPGVVLRSILPTRALGAMLIALAVGFYLIMPSLFALAYYFTSSQLRTTMLASASQLTRFGQDSGSLSGISSSSPLVQQLQQTQYAMGTFWLLILFYPMLISGMTYAFVVQISEFLGSMTHQVGKIRGFI